MATRTVGRHRGQFFNPNQRQCPAERTAPDHGARLISWALQARLAAQASAPLLPSIVGRVPGGIGGRGG